MHREVEKIGVGPMSISPDNPWFRWTVSRWYDTKYFISRRYFYTGCYITRHRFRIRKMLQKGRPFSSVSKYVHSLLPTQIHGSDTILQVQPRQGSTLFNIEYYKNTLSWDETWCMTTFKILRNLYICCSKEDGRKCRPPARFAWYCSIIHNL